MILEVILPGGDFCMGSFGGFYSGEKKKQKKGKLEKKAAVIGGFYAPPKVEIVGKKGKKSW